MSRFLCVVGAVACCLCVLPVSGRAQMQGAPDQAIGSDQLAGQFREATYEALRLAARPGERHRALAPMIGEWNTTFTSWGNPGAEPQVSNGTALFEWEMGGRFVLERTEGTVRGEPYRSMAFLGFDNISSRYVWTRIDNLSSAIQSFEGEMRESDEAGRELMWRGRYQDPVTGEQVETRAVLQFLPAGGMVYTLFATGAHDAGKVLEIAYWREGADTELDAR